MREKEEGEVQERRSKGQKGRKRGGRSPIEAS
ncbi:hypothetical protein BkAM31D_23025 [Halalkalibacter krulwichiae]|uniref:Uncharacterized protein n=1 Tax=Halalkalibacter krulwichiae TaxID=199441 RepID=A0A1X9MGF8_9BACI|nr:hypothetical protein BkAM31D_23025 [Halalkalibacter krulwichiae]